MRALLQGISCQGLGAERLLEKLKAAGVRLYDVRRQDAKTLCFYYESRDQERVSGLLQSLGFACTPLPVRGYARRLAQWPRLVPGAIALLTALCCLAFLLQFFWRIDISGAGAYAGEVRQYLHAQGLRPGRLKSAVQTSQICDDLLYRLPRIAWVRARIQGVTLRIEITQGVPMPSGISQTAAGNIVAVCDGVIAHIDVYAGEAAVSAGDTVRAGDVLIYGRERGKDESFTPVHASGRVTARVWKSASAVLSGTQTQSIRTGRSMQRTVIACPFYRYALQAEPEYLTAETEAERLYPIAAWLPIWVERQTIYEVALEENPRDEQALQHESGRLAMQKLLTFCGGSDEIIDKWLDYSMIEGGNIMAVATAEMQMEIGRFLPISPE